ncbi:hypothetical protein [Nitrosopumilus sp.]|uniref:hypothetical protein n=1 Tax=Nitrosopumilus sp. TaxID=2024843 RepID=UPI0034A07008
MTKESISKLENLSMADVAGKECRDIMQETMLDLNLKTSTLFKKFKETREKNKFSPSRS